MKTTANQVQRTVRPGVVLLVVLAMLTLFATVAIAFVTLSETTAVNFTLNKAAQTQKRPDPDLLCSYALTQLIFENENPNSSLWTHGLVRNMYGSGNTPFSGVGRVRTPVGGSPFFSSDLINLRGNFLPLGNRRILNEASFGNLASPYTYPDHNHAFLGAFAADGTVYERSFVRRASNPGITDPYSPDPSLYVAWWTDTDPFMQNILATARASGAGGTPEWQNAYNELRRRQALVLRPRPSLPLSDPFYVQNITGLTSIGPVAGLMNPGFPIPDDLGGDVKNLPNWFQTRVTPNGVVPPVFASNDSYWTDLDFPIQTDPESGRRYKPIFAFFITDLDGCVNLNFHGNSLLGGGAAPLHASNQGWGPWEINPSRVLYPSFVASPTTPEYPHLYGNTLVSGNGGTPLGYEKGKWGADSAPGSVGSAPGLNSVMHFYSQVNYSGRDPSNAPMAIPSALPAGTNLFPAYPPTYLNAFAPELLRHPLLHQNPLGAGDDRFFPAMEMEALLRHGDTGSYGLVSDLRRLLPLSFREPYATQGNRMARLQVTTHSFDITRAGLAPYLTGTTAPPEPAINAYPLNAWSTIPPPMPPNASTTTRAVALPAPGGNLEGLAGATGGEFLINGPLFRPVNSPGVNSPSAVAPHPNLNLNAVLAKVNLSRYLRPYPHLGSFNLDAAGIDGPSNNYIPGVVPLPTSGPFPAIAVGTALPAQPAPAATPEDISGAQPVRFDLHPAYLAIAQAAERDRQMLAMDIYRRLVALTGVTVPPIPAGGAADPSFNNNLRALRALAQLAVNIVDFIDEDDIATPFCFYTLIDAVGGAIDPLSPPPTAALYNAFDVINPTEIDPERQLRRYWVYGTEMPRLVLTEVLAEFTPAAPGSTVPVRLWAEVASTMPAAFPANNPNPVDLRAEPLFVPELPSLPGTGYAPYQIVVAPSFAEADWPNEGPLASTPNENYNTLGIWHTEAPTAPFRAKTQNADFQNPLGYAPQGNTPAPPAALNPARVPPGQVVIVGPPNLMDPAEPPDFRRSIQADGTGGNGFNGETVGRVPNNTPFLPTLNLSYPVTYNGPNDWEFSGNPVRDWDPNQGVTVLLRRLANPYLPPQLDPTQPAYNPYITIDYMGYIALHSTSEPTYSSQGKIQPMAASRTQVLPQQPNPDPLAGSQETIHTLGSLNNPVAPFQAPAAFDWLAHFDRRLTSVAELLQVSAYKPHELTQKFMIDVVLAADVTANPAAKQTVQVAVADFGHPMPAIRTGMTLRVGGNTPATGNPEYIYVFDARPDPMNPNLWDITAIFTEDHLVGARISVPHGQRAPWLDDSRRLLRLWEFLDAENMLQSKVAIEASFIPLPFVGIPPGHSHLEVDLQASYGTNGNDLLRFEPILGGIVELRDPTGMLYTGIITAIASNERFSVLVPGGPGAAFVGQMVAYSHAGRSPGKINLNAIRSVEVFRALCDAQLANSFNPPIGATAGVLSHGSTSVVLTLPIADPEQPTVPYGLFNGVPWTIGLGTPLEFRHPINGPETVVVTAVAPAGAVIPGTPPTRPFNITFDRPLQSHLLQDAPSGNLHRLDYPAGSIVCVDNVALLFDQLVLTRDGNFAAGYPGRPFQGLTRGAATPNPLGQYPLGSGIVDSVFRPEPAIPPIQPGRTLLEIPAAHPVKSHELVAKILNNTTSRSNTFAIWCTVGFFEVDANGNLGQEIGRQNGRHVRHRFFAIVDRSILDPWVQQQGPNYSVLAGFSGTGNFILGNGSIDPRRPKPMVDAIASATGPDPLNRYVVTISGTNLGIGVGQSLQVNGTNEWVTVLAPRPGDPALGPDQFRVQFPSGGVPANPFRLSSILPSPVLHWSIIE